MANDSSMYDQHRDRFSESNTFITFDQRGSGSSDHPLFEEGAGCSYTVEKFGDDLKAVLDEVGVDRAVVLGFSMGAVAALSFATRWPERVERLVLASAMASRLPQAIIDRARQVEAVLDEKGIEATYDFYFSGALFEGVLENENLKAQISQCRDRATPHGFKGCFRVTIDRPSLVERLDRISCPTLILVGETDVHYLEEAKLLEKKIRGAQRIVMPGVGHAMAVQDPAGFESAVIDFIS